jgi:phosphoglycerate kinase
MEEEIMGNRTLGPNIQHPYIMMLGGVKIDDYLDLVESFLKGRVVDKILATGALGIVGVLGIYGRDNPNYLGEKTVQFLLREGISEEQINRVTGFARRYTRKFILPLDFKVELDGNVFYIDREEINEHPGKDKMGIYGLGPKTVALYKEALEGLKTGYIKGPPTKDDDERFMQESRELIDKFVELKRQGATTILSGGNTNTLVSELGYSPHEDFTFVTLAGGAATRYHTGGTHLPGLLMLNTSYNAFNGVDLYKGLENNPVAFELTAPRIPQNLKPSR